jgi:hypothetical protein
MAAAYPMWFAASLLAVVASGHLLVASIEWRAAHMAWLSAAAFALWCLLSVLFYWGIGQGG